MLASQEIPICIRTAHFKLHSICTPYHVDGSTLLEHVGGLTVVGTATGQHKRSTRRTRQIRQATIDKRVLRRRLQQCTRINT